MVINTSANAADGYRPQVKTTCWSVGFYDFMKNVLKHLLALYKQNLNGKCNWPGSEVKMFQGLGEIFRGWLTVMGASSVQGLGSKFCIRTSRGKLEASQYK